MPTCPKHLSKPVLVVHRGHCYKGGCDTRGVYLDKLYLCCNVCISLWIGQKKRGKTDGGRRVEERKKEVIKKLENGLEIHGGGGGQVDKQKEATIAGG